MDIIGWLNNDYTFPTIKRLRGRPIKDIGSVNFRAKERRTAALEVAYIKVVFRSGGRIIRNFLENPKRRSSPSRGAFCKQRANEDGQLESKYLLFA